MALQKLQESRSGQLGDYWDIVSIHMDILGDAMDVRLELYENATAKSEGKTSMGISKNIVISPLPKSVRTILEGIFTKLKTEHTADQNEEEETPFFSEATNV